LHREIDASNLSRASARADSFRKGMTNLPRGFLIYDLEDRCATSSQARSITSIAHFGKIMIAVCGCSKQTTNLLRTSKGDQYRSSSETGMCWVYWAAFASTLPRGCRAQQITTASASPSWGRFLDISFGPSKFWSRVTMPSLISGGRWRRCWSLRLSQPSASWAACLGHRKSSRLDCQSIHGNKL
jgi:hypothetical protein